MISRVALAPLVRGGRDWRDARLDVRLPDGAHVVVGTAAQPDATIAVRDARALARVAVRGELGAGEAFVAGHWDADDLVAALRLFLRATAARGVESRLTRLARVL